MIIRPAINNAYQTQFDINSKLKDHVDRLFLTKPADWFYTSRIKEIESYAQKLESGRQKKIDEMEDMFACTLVVPTASLIGDAEEFVKQRCTVVERRPASASRTNKPSSDFRFDDLRLYVRIMHDAARPTSPINEIKFEVQVKSFLQHAWTVATHDLIYKADVASWSRSRVAFQIKALLEHAETSIAAMEKLGEVPFLPSDGSPESLEQEIIDVLKREWPLSTAGSVPGLPVDRKRLASNIRELLGILGLSSGDLSKILSEGYRRNGEMHPISLSPFQVVVDYLTHSHKKQLKTLARTGKFDNKPRGRKLYSLVLTGEQLGYLGIESDSNHHALVV